MSFYTTSASSSPSPSPSPIATATAKNATPRSRVGIDIENTATSKKTTKPTESYHSKHTKGRNPFDLMSHITSPTKQPTNDDQSYTYSYLNTSSLDESESSAQPPTLFLLDDCLQNMHHSRQRSTSLRLRRKANQADIKLDIALQDETQKVKVSNMNEEEEDEMKANSRRIRMRSRSKSQSTGAKTMMARATAITTNINLKLQNDDDNDNDSDSKPIKPPSGSASSAINALNKMETMNLAASKMEKDRITRKINVASDNNDNSSSRSRSSSTDRSFIDNYRKDQINLKAALERKVMRPNETETDGYDKEMERKVKKAQVDARYDAFKKGMSSRESMELSDKAGRDFRNEHEHAGKLILIVDEVGDDDGNDDGNDNDEINYEMLSIHTKPRESKESDALASTAHTAFKADIEKWKTRGGLISTHEERTKVAEYLTDVYMSNNLDGLVGTEFVRGVRKNIMAVIDVVANDDDEEEEESDDEDRFQLVQKSTNFLNWKCSLCSKVNSGSHKCQTCGRDRTHLTAQQKEKAAKSQNSGKASDDLNDPVVKERLWREENEKNAKINAEYVSFMKMKNKTDNDSHERLEMAREIEQLLAGLRKNMTPSRLADGVVGMPAKIEEDADDYRIHNAVGRVDHGDGRE